MTPEERQALVDRIARALSWTAETHDARVRFGKRADDLVGELEHGRMDLNAIAWMLAPEKGRK